MQKYKENPGTSGIWASKQTLSGNIYLEKEPLILTEKTFEQKYGALTPSGGHIFLQPDLD
jgi:hypothetical protein